MINPTLASGFEAEGEKPIVGTRRVLGQLTSGQRWTAALAVGLAVAILSFGMPERAVPAAASEAPVAGTETPGASELPPLLSLAPNPATGGFAEPAGGFAGLPDLGPALPRDAPSPPSPPPPAAPSSPPPEPECAEPTSAPPLLAAVLRALFCDLLPMP